MIDAYSPRSVLNMFLLTKYNWGIKAGTELSLVENQIQADVPFSLVSFELFTEYSNQICK